ncbi:MAG TPA: tetratricopeptide repeat protein, partial [Allocoleopsis sp.]
MFIPRCQSARRLLFGLLFGASLFIILGLGQANFSPFRTAAIAQDISAEQWMQRGVDHYQTGSIEEAITDWQSALTLYQANHALEQVAVTLENLARGYQALGQTRMELDYWQRADSIYQQLGNKLRIGRVLMEQAQTYSRMGQYGRAITILCSEPDEVAQICHTESALGIVRSLPERDRVGEVVAYGSLGDAYRLRGEPERALEYLEQGLRIARELQEPVYLISTLNSLGNTHLSLAQLNYRRALSAQQIEEAKEATTFELKAQEQDAKALEYLEESFALAQANADRAAQLRALISTLPIYYRSENREQNAQILQQAIILAESLPYSQEQVYALIDLAKFVQLRPSASTMSTGQHCISLVVEPQAQQLLEQAIISAQQISDRRAESFALGALGHLYECQKDYDRALALTRQAQISADQALQIRDSLYLWQWQTGRIFRAQGQAEQAIEAYEQSLATLDALRK